MVLKPKRYRMSSVRNRWYDPWNFPTEFPVDFFYRIFDRFALRIAELTNCPKKVDEIILVRALKSEALEYFRKRDSAGDVEQTETNPAPGRLRAAIPASTRSFLPVLAGLIYFPARHRPTFSLHVAAQFQGWDELRFASLRVCRDLDGFQVQKHFTTALKYSE